MSIPASVFRFCGYDGVQLTVTDATGETVAESGTCMVRLAEPMNLSLNGGKTVRLKPDGEQQVELTRDSNVFIDDGTVVYTVDDPTIASVSADGTLMGLSNGVTVLTATLLPYGTKKSVRVSVSGGSGEIPGEWDVEPTDELRIASAVRDGTQFTVTLENPADALMLVAAYRNGKMISIYSATVTDAQTDYLFTVPETCDACKVLLLDPASHTPLTASVTG